MLKIQSHILSKIYNTRLFVSLEVACYQYFSLKYIILLRTRILKVIVRYGRNFTWDVPTMMTCKHLLSSYYVPALQIH